MERSCSSSIDIFSDETKSQTVEVAIKLYSNAINIDSGETSFYCLRSYCLSETGSFEAALLDSDKVVNIWSKKPEAFFVREKALAGLRRYLDAAEAQKKVTSLKSDSKDPGKEIERSIRSQIQRDFILWTASKTIEDSIKSEEDFEQKDEGVKKREKNRKTDKESKRSVKRSSRDESASSSKDGGDGMKRKRSQVRDQDNHTVKQEDVKREECATQSTAGNKIGSKIVHSLSHRADYSPSDRKVKRPATPDNDHEFRVVDSIDSKEDDFGSDSGHRRHERSSRVKSPSSVGRRRNASSEDHLRQQHHQDKRYNNNEVHPRRPSRQDLHHEQNKRSTVVSRSRSRSPQTPPLRRRDPSSCQSLNNNEQMHHHPHQRRPRTPSSPLPSPPPEGRRELPVNIYRFTAIRIRNIYPQVQMKLLESLCNRFGKVVDVNVQDREAVVSFLDPEAPRRAIADLNHTFVHRVSNFSDKLIVRFALGCNQDKFHMRNVRRVDCDECHFFRTTGCPDKSCPERHVPANEGIDLQPWMKGGRL